MGDIFKKGFGLRIQDMETMERSKAVGFAPTHHEIAMGALRHANVCLKNLNNSEHVGVEPAQQSGVMPQAKA
ncbi:hypothetical protein [Microvirga guangxiensis]|uniref:hypothetical protein n=1 Tax=Microvirga guangxiensis TaxID=549386 RepID=UPI001AEC786D|nr:hypothetical protein [Microvirga guangxiensis]